MSVREIALHKAVNNFGLTCVGVRECVGGFWPKYNIQLIEKNKCEIGKPVVVDDNLFLKACMSHWSPLSVFVFTHAERGTRTI